MKSVERVVPRVIWVATRRVRMFIALAVAFVLSFIIAGPSASGSIYQYMDDRGVVHFSDVPIDERFHPRVNLRTFGAALSSIHKPKSPKNHGFDGLIYRAAKTNRIEPELVKAVIAAESNFQPEAVSRVGAQGLMQLMPQTASELGVKKPFRARDNVDGGARYLRKMLDRYGDVTRALAAYNAGPEAVDRYQGVPPYSETQAYVKRVLDYYRGYKGEFPR